MAGSCQALGTGHSRIKQALLQAAYMHLGQERWPGTVKAHTKSRLQWSNEGTNETTDAVWPSTPVGEAASRCRIEQAAEAEGSSITITDSALIFEGIDTVMTLAAW